ncbi:hypothetical protein [Luedemannella helvata]|uniref:Uncharacterized protein n=1 Tax=Luedemannella helvata TaxID=349315 RepID=A0ABN2JPY3_9ACTN
MSEYWFGSPGTGLRTALPDPRPFLARVRAGLSESETALVIRQLYGLWLVALLLKALGSSWDVSWHFKWLRDDLAPPHLINVVGDVVMIGLVVFHTVTGFGVDKLALRLMQVGSAVFLVSIPIDVINHRVNGLDITSWSFSHSGLYLGTALAIAGAIVGWTRHATGQRRRTLVLGTLWLFFLENVLFPNQQQEYGTLALSAYLDGRTTAEPSLLAFAANQLGVAALDESSFRSFALPIADWVYLAWVTTAGMIVLVIARRQLGVRWAATAIAGAYVAYRCVMFVLLAGSGFTRSIVPFLLLAGAVAIDLVCAAGLPWAVEGLVGAAVVATAVYAGGWAQGELIALPPSTYVLAPAAAGVLAVGWLAAAALQKAWGTTERVPATAPAGPPLAA